MVTVARELNPVNRHSKHTVMIVDRDINLRKRWTASLEAAGFGLICAVPAPETALYYIQRDFYDLIFVEIKDHVLGNQGLDFVGNIRKQGYMGQLAVTTQSPSADLCFRAARTGANDFLVKGPHLDIAPHAKRLMKNRPLKETMWHPETILSTGLFASLGVTHCELKVLEEFARGFPKQQDIAARMNKDQVYVRKIFSRIYKKLEGQIAIKTQAQLSHLLTICALFS